MTADLFLSNGRRTISWLRSCYRAVSLRATTRMLGEMRKCSLWAGAALLLRLKSRARLNFCVVHAF
jgi:hypothetical protein